MIQQYVTFLTPGSFVPNEQTQKVNSREDKLTVPKNCFAYYFWERSEIEQDGETLYGKEKNRSGRFYFGEVMTEQDVINKVPNNKILLSNMRCNGWDKIVKTRMGNFQPLEKGDTVVTVNQ